jgi:acetyltransferase
VIGIESRQLAEETFESLAALVPSAALSGVLIEEMIDPGRELLVGALNDPQLGTFVTLASGGVDAELGLDRVTFAAPISYDDAQNMLRLLPSAPAFGMWRGKESRDVEALANLLVRTAALAEENCDLVSEIEFNPVVVHEQGAGVHLLDAFAAVHPCRKGS